MKMPNRFQSKLPGHRSYKPSRIGHVARISFRPTRSTPVPILVPPQTSITARQS